MAVNNQPADIDLKHAYKRVFVYYLPGSKGLLMQKADNMTTISELIV
jgi:predicted proteasome-type protease